MKDRRDHAAFYLNLSRTGGDVVPYRVQGRAAFLVNRPEHAERVLAKNQCNYKNPYHPYAELAGRYTPAGSALLRLKRRPPDGRVAAPAGQVTRALVAEATSAASRLQKLSEAGPVGVDLLMKEMMFRAITRVFFEVDGGPYACEFARATTFIEECWANDLFAEPRDAPLALERRYNEAIAVQDETARRIARDAGMTPPGERVPRQLLNAIVRTLLNSYNATATALCWAVHLVSRDTRAQGRLHAEVDEVLRGRPPAAHDLARLQYLRMVVAETLRLYPPAWVLGREALSEDRLGETRIHAGAIVSVSPYTMQRHPLFWERPNEFVPERFDPARARERHPFTYFPFGGGARRCPAGHFVAGHLQTVLAVFLTLCRVEPASDERVRPRGLVALRPDPCVRAKFTPREF